MGRSDTDFSKIFHVTFQIHPVHKPIVEVENRGSVALFGMFMSPEDRNTIRLAREGNEKGEFLPLLRNEWCATWCHRTFPHQPFLERQWDCTIDLLFSVHEIRYTKEVIEDKNHALYIFLERFCLLLSKLNFRWSKIVTAEPSFSSCTLLSPFFNPSSVRGYSNNDAESHLDNQGAIFF